MSAHIAATIAKITADSLGARIETVTPEKSFDELGADSLDRFHIVQCIELEFSITISDEEADMLRTVGDAIAFVVAANSDEQTQGGFGEGEL